MKFGALLAVLVFCTLIISTIDLSQNFVFAQNTTSITPAPELSGSTDDDSSSSEDNDNNESTGTSGSDDDGNSNGGDSQDTSSSEEDETEDDSEQTNPLLEEIRNRVSGALSGSGMPGPGF